MRKSFVFLLLCASSLLAWPETLYVATLRDYSNKETEGLGGALYSVDLGTAKSKLIAPFKVGGVIPIGLTGLAIHPKTGVFYGITAGLSAQIPRSLVTVDPKTGNTTLVGSLGHSASDIRFDSKGTLYAWLNEEARLATVDVGTGAATPIGKSGYGDTLGGGLAIDNAGEFYVSATNAAGTLDRLDLATGQAVVGPRLTGAPYISSINSLAFSSSGMLYAVNSNLGAPAKSILVTIDTKSGAVKELGPLPNDVDPLAFGPDRLDAGSNGTAQQPWAKLAGAAFVGLLVGFALALLVRRRKI